MSNEKRTVKIKENDLVDLIDTMLTEAISIKKQEWINEQNKKQSSKTALLEGRIAKLESQYTSLLQNKKK